MSQDGLETDTASLLVDLAAVFITLACLNISALGFNLTICTM